MSNRTNKYADKAKTPEMVIDGEKGIVPDSAEWHFYFHKRRFFDFLFDLDKDPIHIAKKTQILRYLSENCI